MPNEFLDHFIARAQGKKRFEYFAQDVSAGRICICGTDALNIDCNSAEIIQIITPS